MFNLDTLRTEYIKAVPNKIDQINSVWSCIIKSKSINEDLITLHRLIHNFIGCGKIYNINEIVPLCVKIEYELRAIIESNKLTERSLKKISLMIKSLSVELEKINLRASDE